MGGMLTLIGTQPNLVVATELSRNNLVPFGFFAFTPHRLFDSGGGNRLHGAVGGASFSKIPPGRKSRKTRFSIPDLFDAL